MPKQSSKDASTTASLHKLAASNPVEMVPRSKIKRAAYNPRTLSDKARGKLRHSLNTFGLVETLVWNKRSGTLVGGHQRLTVLDASAGKGEDYLVPCVVVDLDETREKELNIALNNPEAQGEFDGEALAELLKSPGLDIDNALFNGADIMQLFGEDVLGTKPEKMKELSEDMRTARESFEKIKAKTTDRDDPDFYLVVVCKNHAERKTLTDRLGLPDNRYVDGTVVTAAIAPPPPPLSQPATTPQTSGDGKASRRGRPPAQNT